MAEVYNFSTRQRVERQAPKPISPTKSASAPPGWLHSGDLRLIKRELGKLRLGNHGPLFEKLLSWWPHLPELLADGHPRFVRLIAMILEEETESMGTLIEAGVLYLTKSGDPMMDHQSKLTAAAQRPRSEIVAIEGPIRVIDDTEPGPERVYDMWPSVVPHSSK